MKNKLHKDCHKIWRNESDAEQLKLLGMWIVYGQFADKRRKYLVNLIYCQINQELVMDKIWL